MAGLFSFSLALSQRYFLFFFHPHSLSVGRPLIVRLGPHTVRETYVFLRGARLGQEIFIAFFLLMCRARVLVGG